MKAQPAFLPRPTLKCSGRALSLLVLLSLIGLANTARAQTSTSTFSVTATVLASCSVVGGVPLAFGVVTPGVQRDGSVLISAVCTVGTPTRSRWTRAPAPAPPWPAGA